MSNTQINYTSTYTSDQSDEHYQQFLQNFQSLKSQVETWNTELGWNQEQPSQYREPYTQEDNHAFTYTSDQSEEEYQQFLQNCQRLKQQVEIWNRELGWNN